MSEEQHRGGFAPEPPGTYSGDPLSDPFPDSLSDPLTAPFPGRHVPGYAAGDTGTRAVPIAPVTDQAAPDDAGDRPGGYAADPAVDHPADPAAGYAADHPGGYAAEDAAASAGDYAAEDAAAASAGDDAAGHAVDDTGHAVDDTAGHAVDDTADRDVDHGDEAIVPMRAGHRAVHRPRRRLPGCLAAAVAMVVVLALLWVAGAKGYHLIKDHMGGSPGDYAGPGSGSVTFEVHKGDSATVIGRNLKTAGVVQSVDAFIAAAQSNPDSAGIQVGFYQLKKRMKAADALAVLVNPKSLVQDAVVVPEGARVDQIVAAILAKTDLKRADVIAALKDPKALGLPAAAHGNPEGYLFPATYTVAPGESAADLLRQMVAKGDAVRKELHLDTAADSVGLSPEQVITVASILEYEAKRSADYPKVARAIYNRLEAGMPLQSDATVSYANKVRGEVWTTAEMRASDSPYNTYQHTGLPPGPIGSPGETTLQAALNPASGSWLYWVVVNLKTGETVFSDTLAEHNAAVQRFKQYCTTSDAC